MSNKINHKKSASEFFLSIDFLTPLVKSKKFIISSSLIFMVLAGAYDLQQPPKFIASAVIEIGEIGDFDKLKLIQEPSDLIKELKIAFIHKPNVVSEKRVDNRNKFWERQDDLSFEALEEKLIKVSLSSNSENFARKSLEEIISYVIHTHQKILDDQSKEIQNKTDEIDLIRSEMNKISAQIDGVAKVLIENLNLILPILDQKSQLFQLALDSQDNFQNGIYSTNQSSEKDIPNNPQILANLSFAEKLLSVEIEKNKAISELELLNNSDFYTYANLTDNQSLIQQIFQQNKLQLKLNEAKFEFDLSNQKNKKSYSSELIGEIMITKISSNRTLIPFGFFVGLLLSITIVLSLKRNRRFLIND